jgi:hypothetical protein
MADIEEGQVRADGESKDKYIARLEATLRKYAKLNRLLEADLATVRAQCKVHFDNCQELMRVQLKIENSAEKRVTLGRVHGTNEKFVLAPQQGVPDEHKKQVQEFFAPAAEVHANADYVFYPNGAERRDARDKWREETMRENNELYGNPWGPF